MLTPESGSPRPVTCKCGIIVLAPIDDQVKERVFLYECPCCHRVWTDRADAKRNGIRFA